MTEIQRWEYRFETLTGGTFRSPNDEEVEVYLNEMGELGWEIFEIIQLPNTTKMSFAAKRPLTGSTRRRHQFQEVNY